MQFRSHVLRPIDPESPWNRAVFALAAAAGIIGAYLTLAEDAETLLAIEAGGTAFLSWALARELDPDRQVPALVLSVVGGGWALLGPATAILPFTALLMAARLVVETTGRRPLNTDLAGLALVATVVSFTALGWVMGFGLAVAIYVDDRMAEEPNRAALLASPAAAVGSSVVASFSGAFRTMPAVDPLVVAALGALALIAVLREPLEPVSFVDSRTKKFIRRDRLQAGRVLSAVLVFFGAVVSGANAPAVVPMAIVIATALASTEVERLQRANPAPG
ncbi:MAG TPA: hypothetical protein VFU96_10090 [Acidimicrobiia bacterium]|nr:hypothetical protein [Acidimicrobiia bacterium]